MKKSAYLLCAVFMLFVAVTAGCTRTASKTPIASEIPPSIPTATFEIPKVVISTQTPVVPHSAPTIAELPTATHEAEHAQGTPEGEQAEVTLEAEHATEETHGQGTDTPTQEGETPDLEKTVDSMMHQATPTWALTPMVTQTVTAAPGSPAASTPGSVPTFTPPPAFQGVPGMATIGIVAVKRDESVTVQANEFPANQQYIVFMGYQGTRGVNGISVGTFNTGAGGTFTETFKIPVSLKGNAVIDIRVVFEDGKYAYNFFYNTST
ncbi:MAG: hypothetical protein HPY45_02475 [Anaerolineae bacterium]|nr:hypothetical protein [Anaerolineae bacterium]